jgi:hypothetical protein
VKPYKEHSYKLNAPTMKSKPNKHEVACAVAEHFPELASKLPPKRKIWNNEHYRMRIFDAAALGITYFNRRRFIPFGMLEKRQCQVR